MLISSPAWRQAWFVLLIVLQLAITVSPALAQSLLPPSRDVLREAALRSAAAGKPAQIARAALLPQPDIGDVRLSPDGTQISFFRYDAQRESIWLLDVTSGQQSRVVAEVRGAALGWSGDSRRLWMADENGLAVIDVASKNSKRILQWDSIRQQRLWAVDASLPAHAIIHERVRHNRVQRHRYLLVGLDGASRLLHEADWPLRSVRLDAEGKIAVAAAYDGARYDTVIRQYGSEGARELLRCTGIEECRIVGYDGERQRLWLLSQHGRDKLSLQRWQAADGRWELLHQDPNGRADADGLLWDASRNDWSAIAYRGDLRRWYGHDAERDGQLARLQQRLRQAELTLTTSADGRLWLVRAQHSTWIRDRYFLYRPQQDALQVLFDTVPEAALTPSPEQLSPALPVSWRARDGMVLHGFVYLPPGVDAAKAPLIAWLHGGPIGRNDAEFDGRFQLLANRGYVVFLPDFRASIGYGMQYTLAARGDVGNGSVLADVIDGLDALLEAKIGDRDQQAVAGHSFGGYASLLAVSHHPQRFRFAFAGAPPSDYGWIKQWQAEHDSEALHGDGPPLAVQFPHHSMDYLDAGWRRRMRDDSPLAMASKLRVPVYVWAGAHDEHVPLQSIVAFVGAARAGNKSLTLLIDPDARHAPRTPLIAEGWMFLLERAADLHFGGGTEAPSAELRGYLRKHVRVDTQRIVPEQVGTSAATVHHTSR